MGKLRCFQDNTLVYVQYNQLDKFDDNKRAGISQEKIAARQTTELFETLSTGQEADIPVQYSIAFKVIKATQIAVEIKNDITKILRRTTWNGGVLQGVNWAQWRGAGTFLIHI